VPAGQRRATGPGRRAGDLAVGGFVTGLLSLLLGWLTPVVGIGLGGLGVLLGGLGRSRARVEQAPTGLATAGVVLGAVGLAVAVVVWIAAVAGS
jgi:hypothetical protein